MAINHVKTSLEADDADTDLVRPSDWNSAHAYTLQDAVSLSGNTSGVLANISSGTFYLAGGNNITLSQNGNSVTLSGPHTSQFLTTAMASNRGSDFVQATAGFNGTNASGTIASNSISVSVAAPIPIATSGEGVASANSVGTVTRYAAEDHRHVGVFSVGVSDGGNTAGDTAVRPGRIVFAGGNNVTLSMATAAGSLQTITISAANSGTAPPIGTAVKDVASAGSTGTITRFAPEDHAHAGVFSAGVSNVGNTSGDTAVRPGRIVFAGGNNITLSMGTAAGSLQTVTISAFNQTAPVVSNAIQQVSSATGSGTNTSRFAADDHVHLGVYSVGVSTGGNTSGNTGLLAGRMVLAGGNNITLSVGTAAGQLQTITISAPNLGAGAMSAGVSTGGNTSGDTGITGTRLVFAGGNNVTLSQATDANGATVTVSAFNQSNQTLGLYALGNTTQNSSTTLDARTLSYNALGAMTWGYSNGSIQVSAPATSSIVGTNGLSVSTNGSTIYVYPETLSSYMNMPQWGTSAVTFNVATISSGVAFNLPQPGSFSFLRLPILMTMASTTIATLASATATAQMGQTTTWNAVVYSNGVGASSRSLMSVASGSGTWNLSARISITNSTQYSVSLAFSAGVEGGGTTRTTQYSISNTNYSFTSQAFSEFSTNRFLDIPFANSLKPGAYWMLIGRSTSSSSAGAGLTAMTSWGPRYSAHYAGTEGNMFFGIMGSTNLTSGPHLGAAVFSTAGGGTTSAFPISALSSTASNPKMVFQLLRSA